MAFVSPTIRAAIVGDDSSPRSNLQSSGAVSDAVSPIVAKTPRQPAPSIAELSARLYAEYTVEGGSVRLAGCELQPQPILHVMARRITGREKPHALESPTSKALSGTAIVQVQSSPNSAVTAQEQIELFLTSDGQPLDTAAITELGLNDLIKLDKPPKLTSDEASRLAELARSAVKSNADSFDSEIIWCRFASGKLRFAIGDQFVDLPFADWAARLKPPPFFCPHTGRSTFRLAALDDGRIVAAEEIAACPISGQRMLRTELVTCSVTGKRVSPELTEICPATRQPVLQSEMLQCPTCRNRISPPAIVRDRCKLCCEPTTTIKTDSRMVPILAAHPGLNRWQAWKMATTPETLMLEACGLWRQLLVVFDKQSLRPLHVLRRNRLQRTWTDVPQSSWPEILQQQ